MQFHDHCFGFFKFKSILSRSILVKFRAFHLVVLFLDFLQLCLNLLQLLFVLICLNVNLSLNFGFTDLNQFHFFCLDLVELFEGVLGSSLVLLSARFQNAFLFLGFIEHLLKPATLFS